GVLSSDKMAGAFTLLRSNDLLWAPAVNNYLKGQRAGMNDLMAWNADGTRMPWRMHSDYLRFLYLQNDLARGEFQVGGVRIDLSQIQAPMFVVGTETDHVAPWRSVYKVRALTRSPDYTFLLTSGGHNAGIVSGPAHPKRRFRELTLHDAQQQPGPDDWLARANAHTGSWWPWWQQWLAAHSSRHDAALPSMGNAPAGYGIVGDAPGEYVLQR
ncbi:MAG: poly-beta-hydroxybutyrate polymerase, partial [Proteobacteria bacterium]|nr:poly-beta-hydroxybutyrate polymerase [Pseudomonadota bacterium]